MPDGKKAWLALVDAYELLEEIVAVDM